MSAFSFEYDHAKQEGVRFHWHKAVVAIEGTHAVEAIRVTHLQPTEGGAMVPLSDSEFSVRVGLVVLAIGQSTHTSFLPIESSVKTERGRILIERTTGQTTNPKIFAGGDCTNGGREVVDAVADGKRSGVGIVAYLNTQPSLNNPEARVAHA
jgi:dihydropyrimidine dehydrogenase (NAD+) subunit PreT